MASGREAATAGWALAGQATVTRPAPARRAPRAARTAAPDFPTLPATRRMRPRSPLWARGARALKKGRAQASSRASPAEGRQDVTPAGMPMSSTWTSPQKAAPSGV